MRRLTLMLFLILCCAVPAQAEQRSFTLFSADLPEGWDGDERQGFKSGNPEEYMLILGHSDASREGYDALISIFVLPNDQRDDSPGLAQKLAQFQANASTPRPQGGFWSFNGEPRSQSFNAPAVTRVATTPQKVFIAIVQDPEQKGGEKIFSSLKGLTPETQKLLGQ